MPSATAARPLVVVLHGAGGRAEPHCERWRALTRGAAFLVCPRGAPLGLTPAGGEPAGYFYPDHHALGREVLAALEAARRAFGAHLDLERPLFAGYSQGAAMGALFLHDLAKKDIAPVRFGAAALVEGGAGAFDVPLSQRLVARGLRRVLLACGQRSCARDAERSVPWMRRAGLEVRFEDAPGAGHTWGGAVGADVEAALPWLLEGDPRWGGGEEPPP